MLPAEGLKLLPEKTIGFGRLKFALFAMLKNSARNSTLVLSVIGTVLNSEKSNSAKPGPSSTPRPRFPQVPNVGRLKAFGSYHWSTRPIFTGPLKFGFVLGRSGLNWFP